MKVRAGFYPTAGLLLLSVLWASGWLLPDLFPSAGARRMSVTLGEAIFFSGMALLSSLISLAQKIRFSQGRRSWAWGGIGGALFVAPACAAAFARRWISDFDQVATFSLIPIFVTVLEPHINQRPSQRGKAALAGGLVAFAGILCLFPLEIPGSFGAGAALVTCLLTALGVAAANCIAVRLASDLLGEPMLPAAAQAAGASAACFGVIAVITRVTPWETVAFITYFARLLVIDIPGFFLLFWLMSRMAASRMAARFLLAPLFAALIGLAIDGAAPPLRAVVGLVLLAGGAGWLVFAPADDPTGEIISLRSIG